MVALSKRYYQFLGFHNLLIGLFPFFLPVYLYKSGLGLEKISQFIGITGMSFCLCLFLFERIRGRSSSLLVTFSFLFELFLLFLLVIDGFWWLLAIVNGFYSCLYWTIQRVLFLAGGTAADSGRRFGNFQIYVLVALNVGILFGSGLLDNYGILAVCGLSVLVVVAGLVVLNRGTDHILLPSLLQKESPMSVEEIVSFRDTNRSRLIFGIDGIFLYLESYFWVISLFLYVGENFLRLGGVVVVAALVLAVIFMLIKNKIDTANRQKIYLVAVFLYVCSWLIRGGFSYLMDIDSRVLHSCAILLTAFATAFFRLAFNKRFFDLAEKSSQHRYLYMKSYYSQFGLGVVFLLASLGPALIGPVEFLTGSYFLAAVLAGLYLLYKG